MEAPLLQLTKNVSKFYKRNLGVFAPALQKATDPIQQLFVDKIREYKSKSAGGKLVEPSPEMEKEYKNDRERVIRQFGGQPGEDLTSFPALQFAEPTIESPSLPAPSAQQ